MKKAGVWFVEQRKYRGFIGHGSKPQEVSPAEIENILKASRGWYNPKAK